MGRLKEKAVDMIKVVKRLKAVGIIVSILMILLGIVTCFNPLLGQSIVIWMMIAGLFIYGIEEILTYCASPKKLRNGFALATGIIWVVLCVLLFINAIRADEMTNLFALVGFNYFMAIMVGIACIFNAVDDFCLCSRAEEAGSTKSAMIVSGILKLLAGMIIMTYPVGSMITLEVFYAIFLLVAGVTLLVRCLSFKAEETEK